MAKSEALKYKEYLIYPRALYLPTKKVWQATVLITRDTHEDETPPHSQSFPQLAEIFNEEAAALSYALQYGLMLIDGKQQGLTI